MRRLAGLLAVLVLALTACGGSGASWPKASHALRTEGITWVKGSTFGDSTGPLFQVKPAPRYFVVAGGGLFYGTRDETAPEHLFYADADGSTDLGNRGDVRTLKASPDRRWLAFIDFTPRNELAHAVVVDTRTGAEVLRTSKRMGDPGDEDISDVYSEIPPAVELVTDDTVWFSGPRGFLEYRLSSDELVEHGEDAYGSGGSQRKAPWFDHRSGRVVWSPSRNWHVFVDRDPVIASSDGTRVNPKPAGRYRFFGWLDDTTLYGRLYQQLVTCTAPDFTCSKVPGALGDSTYSGVLKPGEQNVLLPNGFNWDVISH